MGGLLVLVEDTLIKAAVETASAVRPGVKIAVLAETCGEEKLPAPVLGGFACAKECRDAFDSAAVALNNGALRLHWMNRLQCMGYIIVSLIHPLAAVSANAAIGEGTFVHLGAVVGAGSSVGRGCMLCPGCVVSCGCAVRDGANLCCGAHVDSGCSIGYRASVGAGAVIAAGVCVGDDAVVCPGTVVIKDVGEAMIVAGSPACVTGNAAFDCVR